MSRFQPQQRYTIQNLYSVFEQDYPVATKIDALWRGVNGNDYEIPYDDLTVFLTVLSQMNFTDAPPQFNSAGYLIDHNYIKSFTNDVILVWLARNPNFPQFKKYFQDFVDAGFLDRQIMRNSSAGYFVANPIFPPAGKANVLSLLTEAPQSVIDQNDFPYIHNLLLRSLPLDQYGAINFNVARDIYLWVLFLNKIYPDDETRSEAMKNLLANNGNGFHGINHYDQIHGDLRIFVSQLNQQNIRDSFTSFIIEQFRIADNERDLFVFTYATQKAIAYEFPTLTNLLESIKLSDVMNAARIAELSNLFDSEIPETQNLFYLFHYYLRIPFNPNQNGDGWQQLINMLDHNKMREAISGWKMSDDVFYLTHEEFEKIKTLYDNLGMPFEKPQARVIGNYLKTLTPPKPKFPENQIDQFRINFLSLPNPENYNQDSKNDLNARFKALLGSRYNPAQIDKNVLGFFTTLYQHQEYFDDLSDKRKEEFCEFFHKNKFEIAHLLTQDDGLEEMFAISMAISDGCGKNITSVFNMALNNYCLRKSLSGTSLVEVGALSECFNAIYVTQINKTQAESGKYYIGAVDNPLDHEGILDCYINPFGLIKLVNSKFDNPKKMEYLREKYFNDGDMKDFQAILNGLDDGGFLLDNGVETLFAFNILSQIPEIAFIDELQEFNEKAIAYIDELQNEIEKFKRNPKPVAYGARADSMVGDAPNQLE